MHTWGVFFCFFSTFLFFSIHTERKSLQVYMEKLKPPAVVQSSLDAVLALRNSLADVLTKAIADG